jgi:hypothetical protein
MNQFIDTLFIPNVIYLFDSTGGQSIPAGSTARMTFNNIALNGSDYNESGTGVVEVVNGKWRKHTVKVNAVDTDAAGYARTTYTIQAQVNRQDGNNFVDIVDAVVSVYHQRGRRLRRCPCFYAPRRCRS